MIGVEDLQTVSSYVVDPLSAEEEFTNAYGIGCAGGLLTVQDYQGFQVVGHVVEFDYASF